MRGPMFKEFDISLMKVIPIAGRTRFEFRIEALNVFNSVNYVPVTGIGSTIGNYEVSGLTGTNTARVVQLVSRVTW
jgi:hypothetical protein